MYFNKDQKDFLNCLLVLKLLSHSKYIEVERKCRVNVILVKTKTEKKQNRLTLYSQGRGGRKTLLNFLYSLYPKPLCSWGEGWDRRALPTCCSSSHWMLFFRKMEKGRQKLQACKGTRQTFGFPSVKGPLLQSSSCRKWDVFGVAWVKSGARVSIHKLIAATSVSPSELWFRLTSQWLERNGHC